MAKHIIVGGSLAYDRVLDFPGVFSDHIIPRKVHTLNLSFTAPTVRVSYGGCAGNIAYTLSLLSVRPIIWSAGGKDFDPYLRWLENQGISARCIAVYPSELTAAAYVITDRADNQISGFHLGALALPARPLPASVWRQAACAIISPEDPPVMRQKMRACKREGVPFVFDPGQAIPACSPAFLREGIRNAWAAVANDYEWALIEKRTGWRMQTIRVRCPRVVLTRGEKGSWIWEGGVKYAIPAARARRVADPTGAGDAYRAGLVAGWMEGKDTETAGRMASLAAVYAVERNGTQNHTFSPEEFARRFRREFGVALARKREG